MLKERSKIKVDQMLKCLLIAVTVQDQYIGSVLPGEHITVLTRGKKAIGALKQTFEQYWGESAARALYNKDSVLTRHDFYLMWWDGVAKVMYNFPKIFHVWVTK